MIDLHTHSLFSDGELLPSELIRRAKTKGYRIVGISDHVDLSNMENTITSLVRLREKGGFEGITFVPGVEITHVPKGSIREMIRLARSFGAFYVVVHGETLVEPVEAGTNQEAIEGGADILAHPGLITEEEVRRAVEKGVLLEISARKGHSLANGHVARLALKTGAGLIYDTDSHSPSDLTGEEEARRIVLGAGLTGDDFVRMQEHARDLVLKVTQGKR
jgi:putative hydrolase